MPGAPDSGQPLSFSVPTGGSFGSAGDQCGLPSTSIEALSRADQSDCSWRARRLGIPVRRRPLQLRVHSHGVALEA